MGSYLYTSTWIAKKVIRLQTEGGGKRKGSYPSPSVQLQLTENGGYKVCQFKGEYSSLTTLSPLQLQYLGLGLPNRGLGI